MQIIKETILYSGQTAYINLKLNANTNLLDYQQEINNLTSYKMLDVVNEPVDAEKRKFSHVKDYSDTLIFYFYNSYGRYTNNFTGASFTTSDIQSNSQSTLNSFFIMDFYDTNNIAKQTKLFSTHLTKIIYGTTIPIYSINWQNKNQFYYLYVPRSYINAQTNAIITGYTKISFYSAKNGSIKTFIYTGDSGNPITSLSTPEKLFIPTELNFSGRTWRFITKSHTIKLWQLATSYDYDNRMTDTFSKEISYCQKYPAKTIFNYSGATYI